MIFENLGRTLDDEQNINEAVKKSIINTPFTNQKSQSSVSRILTSLSHYGMNYNDKVIKNMQALPADKLLQPKSEQMLQQSLYGDLMNSWKLKPEEEKPFSEKALSQKRDVLRRMAMQPELEDILDIMTNEAVVPDDENTYICKPFLDKALIQDLNEQSAAQINDSLDTAFYKLYMLLNWKQKAWDDFKRWLIDGVLSYEIIYDNIEHPRSIIGIVAVDPVTLTKEVVDGTTYWVQFKGQISRERRMLDSQIIYIKYEDTGVTMRQSYLERLIRPFNIYRIIEQAQIIWTVTQSSFKTMFTIPVGGMSRAKGAQTLRQAMNSYREDVKFNSDTGELLVNDSVNLPFNQEYWMPQNEQGAPDIQTVTDNGPQLNDSEQIKYFQGKLYAQSKIPSARFDKEAQSAWFGTDPTQALRDEINFTRFVNKLRDVFGEILAKPLRIQVSLSVPDLKNDKRILSAISLDFNSYNPFEEMMNIEIMSKRIEFIGNMAQSIVITDDEGNETPYFSPKFLVERYLRLSNADMELNEKYKLEDQLAKQAKAPEAAGGSASGNADDTAEGGDVDDEQEKGPESENGDVDKEMLGEVQPESSETTEA